MLDLEHAVRLLVDEMLIEVRKIEGEGADVSLVFEPVIDADTAEVAKVSLRIEKLTQDEARRMFPRFAISPMDSRNIDNADYVISGIIPLERLEANTDKRRHLSMSVVDRKSGKVVAHSGAWIANEELDFELTPMYRDSPMYMNDKRVKALIATAKAAAGSLAEKEYFDSLATSALLAEGSRAYDQDNYLLALGLFAKAAERGDGQVMKTFSGLYQSFYRLNRTEEAEQAFATLTELGMRNGYISVKFLFNVNATEFYGGEEARKRYRIWLRQIARNISTSDNCAQIVGHASHSGTEQHNMVLSLKRAELVQARLGTEEPTVRKKTKAIGRGFAENIIGTGTNDASDAIDRRVEFRLTECGL
jgi:outer membrane protein OmpA-like peptidoglycan-associated protein